MEEQEKKKLILLVSAVFILGSISGWGLFRLTSRSTSTENKTGEMAALISGQEIKVGKTYGQEGGVFKDEAEGMIIVNDEGGQGTHKLIREGGESQSAHLISSVLDLNLFIDHKVKVWGETFSSDEVGWLMDVGRVEVLQ